MSQHTIVNSQLVSAAKAGIFLQRPGDSLVGKRDRWRERGRARHRARHVGNTKVHDAVHHVRRAWSGTKFPSSRLDRWKHRPERNRVSWLQWSLTKSASEPLRPAPGRHRSRHRQLCRAAQSSSGRRRSLDLMRRNAASAVRPSSHRVRTTVTAAPMPKPTSAALSARPQRSERPALKSSSLQLR